MYTGVRHEITAVPKSTSASIGNIPREDAILIRRSECNIEYLSVLPHLEIRLSQLGEKSWHRGRRSGNLCT